VENLTLAITKGSSWESFGGPDLTWSDLRKNKEKPSTAVAEVGTISLNHNTF